MPERADALQRQNLRAPWRRQPQRGLGARRKKGEKSNAGKGLGATRTYALLSQPETGKISCVHRLPWARLSPGAPVPNGEPGPQFRSGAPHRRAVQTTRTGLQDAALAPAYLPHMAMAFWLAAPRSLPKFAPQARFSAMASATHPSRVQPPFTQSEGVPVSAWQLLSATASASAWEALS